MAEGAGRPVCGCGLPARSLGYCLWHYSAARRARLDPERDREQILKLGIQPGKYRQYPGWEREILQATTQDLLSRLEASEAREQLQRTQIERLSLQHREDTRTLRRLEIDLERAASELERERERGLILESQIRMIQDSKIADLEDRRLLALQEENRLLRRKIDSQRQLRP
jgi:hypothetical protein